MWLATVEWNQPASVYGNYFRIKTCLALPPTTTTGSWLRMAPLAVPEPMNATTNHSKLRVYVTLPTESAVAGRHVTGKMEVECKSDQLGIGIILVELLALQGTLAPISVSILIFILIIGGRIDLERPFGSDDFSAYKQDISGTGHATIKCCSRLSSPW